MLIKRTEELTTFSGARLFVSSTVTGESLEYFVPARLAALNFSSVAATYRAKRFTDLPCSIAPLAAMVAMRGRTMLSTDIIAKSRSLQALNNLWRTRHLDATSLCALHVSATSRKSPSRLRDSAVWVDGLRPRDAALVPCPASMLPGLLEDYFVFMARTEVPYWIRLAVGHYQLLMMHPFFDGNGRLSRMMALLHAERFLPRTAMAIAAALALRRRTLRGALDMMRQGDVESYLRQWSKLLSSAETAMETINCFGLATKCRLAGMLDTSDRAHRFVRMALDEPLFTCAVFATQLNLSHKLSQSWLDKLLRLGLVEYHPSNADAQIYRCPAAVEFWRHSMESFASYCAETLDGGENISAAATSPSL